MNVDDGTIRQMQEIERMNQTLRSRFFPMKREPTDAQLASGKVKGDDPCPCGSGFSFAWCCWSGKKPIAADAQ